MPTQSQYGHTLFLSNLDEGSAARTVERVHFSKPAAGAAGHDEQWLQRLIMRHPSLLPVDQIEASEFTPLVPICLELPLRSGFLDNLLVTPDGNLVLVECKLWRNPQARREVVGQILDYASEMATWQYETLQKAIRQGKPAGPGKSLTSNLYELACPTGEIDEAFFHDAVSRNLKRGRFLLLIVGDGIRAETEVMVEFLQGHGGIHFTLALVELALFTLPEGGFIAQPRIPMKTVNVERGVVTFEENAVSIKAPSKKIVPAVSSGTRTTISQERYSELLEQHCPGVSSKLIAFTGDVAILNVAPEFGTNTMILRWRPPDGNSWNLGTIASDGQLWTEYMGQQASSRGLLDEHKRYLAKLAETAGAVVKTPEKESAWYVASHPDSKVAVTVDALVSDQRRRNGWLDAIKEFQKAVINRTHVE